MCQSKWVVMPITEYQTWTSTTIKKSLDRNMNNFNENLTNSKPIICIIYGKVCLPSYILSWFPTAHWCQLNFLLLIIQWCAWWTRLIPACYEIYGCESTLIVEGSLPPGFLPREALMWYVSSISVGYAWTIVKL